MTRNTKGDVQVETGTHAISDWWKFSRWEVFRTRDGRMVAIVPGQRLARLMCRLANAFDHTSNHGGLDYPSFDYERPGYGWLIPPGSRARLGWPAHLPLRDGELHTWTGDQLDDAIVDWDATAGDRWVHEEEAERASVALRKRTRRSSWPARHRNHDHASNI